MSMYSSIRDAIVTVVSAVTNIGTVHDRVRFSADWPTYLSQFKTTVSGRDEILGWMVSWRGIPETNVEPGQSMGRFTDLYKFVVRGMMGVKDGDDTETTFSSLAESVLEALRAQSSFGVTGVVKFSVFCTMPVLEDRMFGGTLCHYCEIDVNMLVDQAVTYV